MGCEFFSCFSFKRYFCFLLKKVFCRSLIFFQAVSLLLELMSVFVSGFCP